MEGLPFRLILSLVIAAVIVSLVFYEVSVYQDFTAKKNFADDIADCSQAMKTLVSTGDYGSFTRVDLTVPQQCNFTLDNLTDKIVVNFFGEVKQYNATGNILWYRSFGPGTYELELYYGAPPYNSTEKNYTVPFV